MSGVYSPSYTAFTQPFKFSVYRNGAWTGGNQAFAKVALDTKLFDTGSNFDAVTNNRFIAPIAGFYYFCGRASSSGSGGVLMITSLYKNGSEVIRGTQLPATAGANPIGSNVEGVLQLAAADYIELYHFGDNGSGDTGSPYTFLHGFLMSVN